MSKAKGDCFQIIGVDVFIDSDLKAWVLEINDSPSLNINLCKEGGKGEGLIKLDSEVDKHIKTKIVGTALKMLVQTKKKDRQARLQTRFELDSYKCWQRLPTDQYFEMYRPYLLAACTFMKLSGKDEFLTCSKFSKLSK